MLSLIKTVLRDLGTLIRGLPLFTSNKTGLINYDFLFVFVFLIWKNRE